MKQITEEILVDFIRKNEIELKSTHSKLCLPIINRLYRKMLIGIKFSNIKVADTTIIDGHHRYISSLLANIELERNPSIIPSAAIVTNWTSIVFVDEDWDTPAKLKMLNEQDADYNNIPIAEIIELLE